MSKLMKQKRDQLVDELAWSVERAQGYVDGEQAQQQGLELAIEQKVGMDDYSKGFRTGYYTRACSLSAQDMHAALVAH